MYYYTTRSFLLLIFCVSSALQLFAQFAPPVEIAAVSDARALVAGDFDNDGDIDVLVAAATERQLYLNDGTANFSAPAILPGDYNLGLFGNMKAADLDDDGDLDIISSAPRLIWQRNDGGGVFSDPMECTSSNPGNPLFGNNFEILDFNNDGLLDLVYGHYLEGQWLALNTGDASFPTDCSEAYQISGGYTNSHAYGDVDMSGYADVVACNSDNFTVRVKYSDNTAVPSFGSFLDIVSYMYVSMSANKVTDLNNDGYGDIIFHKEPWSFVAHTTGGSFFIIDTIGQDDLSIVAAADVNGDGLTDLLGSVFNSFGDPIPKIVYYHNEGDFAFTPVEIALLPNHVQPVFGDLDGDGGGDIVIVQANKVVWYRFEDAPLSTVVQLYHDADGDGMQDAEETPVVGAAIELVAPAETYYTNENGQVRLYLVNGDFTFGVVPDDCWSLPPGTPALYDFTVTGTEVDTLRIGLQFEEDENSEITGYLTSAPTRCFTEVRFDFLLDPGCQTPAGVVALVLNEQVTFLEAEQAPDLIDGHTLWWELEELSPGIHPQYIFRLSMPSEMATGDSLHFEWYYYGEDCEALPDVTGPTSPLSEGLNICAQGEYEPVVLCSFDPNDKQVIPFRDEVRNLTLFEETLEYKIRFQNTGNDTAFIVRIKDVLDAGLDWESLEVVGSSHAHEVMMNRNTGEMTFTFDNILLPDSTTNESASHGFVTYRIESLTGLPEQTLVTNQAGIFFDFNPPILTNTTTNELVSVLPITPVADFTHVVQNGNFNFSDASLNTPENWLWDFGDGQSSTEASPIHTYATEGNYEVCLTVDNWAGSSVNCQEVEYVITSLEDIFPSIEFTIAPNPTTDLTLISWSEPLPTESYLQLYDVLGKPLVTPVSLGGRQQFYLDMSDYPAGTYFVKIINGKQSLDYRSLVRTP